MNEAERIAEVAWASSLLDPGPLVSMERVANISEVELEELLHYAHNLVFCVSSLLRGHDAISSITRANDSLKEVLMKFKSN